MLWTVCHGRLIGAVREAGGICFVDTEGTAEDGVASLKADGELEGVSPAAAQAVHVADENLAGPPCDLVCMASVVDASLAGVSALLLLRSCGEGGVCYVLIELFDSNRRLQPTSVLSFTVSAEEDAECAEQEDVAMQDAGAGKLNADPALLRQPLGSSHPWILDGPVVCIPRKKSLIVAHLALVNRRGEVADP